jgi:hypothetical protein
MRNRNRWPTLAVLFVVEFASGCVQSPNAESAEGSANGATANAPPAPEMTVNQLMHGIFFPLGNAVFYSQLEDPATLSRDTEPSTSPNPLTGLYGGWQAIENSALAVAEAADLLLIPGRVCSNGEVPNVADADWIRFVDDMRKESVKAYEAALTKNQDAMVEVSGTLSDTCFACHRVYRREPIPGDGSQRCIPGAPTPRR